MGLGLRVKNKENLLPSDVPRKRLIKTHVKTNPHYGKSPKDRTLEELFEAGVLLVDKPSGPTCHQIDAWVRDMLNISKVGHAGTLDPKVTGVLPLGIGKATRGLHVLSSTGKEYIAVMKLHNDVSEEKVKQVLKEFIGTIEQLPPVRSAVKRVRRKRNIYYIKFLEKKDRDVLFKVGCQAGTYVRTLCVDLGKRLGCKAHMAKLRRTRVGNIYEDNLTTLHDVKDAYEFWKEDKDYEEFFTLLYPIEILFNAIPKIIVRDSAVDALCHGADLAIPGVVELDTKIEKNDPVAIMTLKKEVVAFGKAICSTENIINKDHGVCASVDQVFMKKGTYPSIWKKH